jgi:NTE family protein
MNKSFGEGKERALVLGGGGIYFASWMLGYFHSLTAGGVDLELSDVIVGTSAGSFVGSSIAGGHLARLTREFDFLGKIPELMATLLPSEERSPSQQRALEILKQSEKADPETLREIGRAAMASHNSGMGKLQRVIGLMTGNQRWPSPKFHATGIDCYSGERVTISEQDDIPIASAVSASMSLPGSIGPTWLKDQLCMDGGICGTSTHCDLVAGAKRALVLSLSDGNPGGPRLSSLPNSLQQEIKDLEAAGTQTFLVVANPKPDTNLLSPLEMLPAMKSGAAKGKADLAKVKKFWMD